MDGKTKKVVVAGDVTIDWLQWDIKTKDEEKKPNWKYYPGYKSKTTEGGAILMVKMLKEALNACNSKNLAAAIPSEIISQKLKKPLECISPEEVIHSITYLGNFKGPKNGPKKVHRVTEFRGFVGPEDGPVNPTEIDNDDHDADIVLIDDAGNGFRDDSSAWPEAIGKSKNPLVIYKMSRPIVSGKLWKKLVEDHFDNLVVILSANDLREHGVNISRKLSWERTAEDFMWQIENNPEITDLKRCSHLIVRFGIDGAIYYKYNDNNSEAKLFFDPMVFEEGYIDKVDGDMQGYGNAFVASIAARIIHNGLDEIDNGVKEGIESARNLLDYGFGDAIEEPGYSLEGIFSNYNNSIAETDLTNISENELWTILGSRPKWEIENIVSDIVIEGPGTMVNSVPVGQFGGLFTVDRLEIEGYQSIRNLMNEYLKNNNDRPLSIAVFGPPGSGKSFGVKQLAKSISDEIEDIEFNVSQFNDLSDLQAAMHKIRDMVLEGKIPLVFFDEFDSNFNGDLGWLKYFLAPMQDGMFKEGESMHPIGRAIFIFAGGTSDTFQLFSREEFPKDFNEDQIKESSLKFRNAKGTDFVSRLRGYVNILGPNPFGDEDSFYMIRRAIFLRSLLERKVKNIFSGKKAKINPGVLSAFIKVPKYKHGVRSMEAIIDMSVLSDRNSFEQSALPSEKQLEMHVGADIFNRFVVQDTLFGNAIEKIAIQIHEKYREDQKGIKEPDDPAMQPWAKLDEDYKNSNRDQARDIPRKLKSENYDFRPLINKLVKRISFNEDEVERMAIMEHERFCIERKGAGWTDGESRSLNKKESPYLDLWNALDEEVREYDRQAVRNIPKVLEKAGFEIYSLK